MIEMCGAVEDDGAVEECEVVKKGHVAEEYTTEGLEV